MAGDALRTLQATVGLIPNLAATMAESCIADGFLALRELYTDRLFTGEVQVLSLTAAYETTAPGVLPSTASRR